jgi:uncharacterized membrane protein YecN with MAPEG domain
VALTTRLHPTPNFVLLTVHLDISVVKTNQMHYVSFIYFVSQPLHVSGMFIAHHQAVFTYMYRNWYVLFVQDPS